MQELSGAIDRVITRDEESSFTIARLMLDDGSSQTLLAKLSVADEGLWVEAQGQWVSHQTHGSQFKAESARVFQPRGASGIERFLASGAVKGIGRHFAKKIVARYKEKTLDVIVNRHWEMKYLKGVGPKRIKAIRESIKEYQDELEVLTFLHERFGPDRATTIFSKYGKNASKIIKKEPYRLVEDIDGMGFQAVDAIARTVGVTAGHDMRLRAAIFHTLNEAGRQGHTCVPEVRLKKKLKALLEPPAGLGDDAMGMVEQGEIAGVVTYEDDHGEIFVELERFKRAEREVCERLIALRDAATEDRAIDVEKAVSWAEGESRIRFEPEQAEAIATSLSNQVSIITGGPGVGKTTILKALILVFAAKKLRIGLAAPTGRAARRLSESTGREATTLHRLLGKTPGVPGFAHNAKNKLALDVLVIDEASMVDLSLLRSTLAALRNGTRLVVVGDKDQLPSVGSGQILNDIIVSGQFAVSRLKKPFRQAEGSKIIQNSRLINGGIVPDLDNKDLAWCFLESDGPEDTAYKIEYLMTVHLPKQGIDTQKDVQVLVPLNRGASGLHEMNKRLQAGLNGSEKLELKHRGRSFRLNDKVTQRKNNVELDVSNGDWGYIKHVDVEEKMLTVDFQGRDVVYTTSNLGELDLGYSLTIHRSQGSEYQIVIVAMDTAASVLLDRKLFYTACTRAKEKVIIVGQKRAVNICVSEAKANDRFTMLANRLRLSEGVAEPKPH